VLRLTSRPAFEGAAHSTRFFDYSLFFPCGPSLIGCVSGKGSNLTRGAQTREIAVEGEYVL
jgi:hypothetical protein